MWLSIAVDDIFSGSWRTRRKKLSASATQPAIPTTGSEHRLCVLICVRVRWPVAEFLQGRSTPYFLFVVNFLSALLLFLYLHCPGRNNGKTKHLNFKHSNKRTL